MVKLNEGDIAPDFSATDQGGNPLALKGFRGKKVVLYFYPKDDTPGCTKEACSFRDHYKELQDAGYEIIGVSADNEKKHQKFIDKFDLPFPLIPDTEKQIINDYGIWGEKKFMGRVYDGIHRKTFVIDEKGKIERIIDKVKNKEAAQQILNG